MSPIESAKLVLSTLIVAGTGTAQGEWKYRVSANVPTWGSSGAMAHDSSRGEAMLIVPIGEQQITTWVWDGEDWTLRATTQGFPYDAHAMAFDVNRNLTVLFGHGTWEWNGIGWTLRIPATSPRGRLKGHAIAYDEERARVVLFGGYSLSNTVLSDTWEWDGTTWTELRPLTAPPARQGHAMTYDSERERVVLFGGTTATNDFAFRDTWEWDGSNWFERYPQTSPPARWGHQLAFDTNDQRTILFGGQDAATLGYLGDTWSWDGSDWVELRPLASPARRAAHAMAYDSRRHVVVLFGGTNGNDLRDTWEYERGVAGTFSTFGAGCPGSRGVPFLTLRSSPPVAGQPFAVQVNRLPLAGAAFMFLGASKSDYLGLMLPFDLGIIGMNGCLLYASAERVDNLSNVLGVALWTVQIPPSFAGRTFYVQSIIFDPFANLLGMTVSNAGEAFVGG